MRFSFLAIAFLVIGAIDAFAKHVHDKSCLLARSDCPNKASLAKIGRFAVQVGAAQPVKANLTRAEQYARDLTHTAHRRQVSEVPPSEQSASLGIVTGGLTFGYLTWDEDAGTPNVVVGAANPYQWTYTASPSWITSAQQRIKLSNPAASFPILGLATCDSKGRVMSLLNANYVCLTGVSNPGTVSGSVPVAGVPTLGNANPGGVETNVWAFDYVLGTITARWVNPDGVTVVLALMVNTQTGKIVATGNVALFLLANGANWSTFVLTIRS